MKDLAMGPAPQQTAEPNVFDPERNPARVLWAAGLFALLWILPLLIQSIFSPHTTFCADALDLSALAVLAAGVYFLCRTGGKQKLIGGALAVAGAVLLAFSAAIASAKATARLANLPATGLLAWIPSISFPPFKEALLRSLRGHGSVV